MAARGGGAMKNKKDSQTLPLPLPGVWMRWSDAQPEPGEWVLTIFKYGDEYGNPVIACPIRDNGSHLINGESIYIAPVAYWMQIPPAPHARAWFFDSSLNKTVTR